jgi:hypothetical protein
MHCRSTRRTVVRRSFLRCLMCISSGCFVRFSDLSFGVENPTDPETSFDFVCCALDQQSYKLDLTVDISMSSKIVSVVSPTHLIAFNRHSEDLKRGVVKFLGDLVRFPCAVCRLLIQYRYVICRRVWLPVQQSRLFMHRTNNNKSNLPDRVNDCLI